MSGIQRFRRFAAATIVTALLFTADVTLITGQDLVPVSSLTGGTSVFVFRNTARQVRRTIAPAKPARTKDQRMATVVKIKKQYETLAKSETRRVREKVLEPSKLPPNARTLPAAQGAKLFAGVGEFFLGKADYEQATQFFRDALSLDDTNKAANEGLAEALARKGNDLLVADKKPLAKANYLEALKFDPNNSAALFGLGEIYSESDQPAEAIASYEKSLASDQKLTEIYVPLGILYFQAGDIARADDLLTKALAFSAESAETQFFLGLVRAAQGKDVEALAGFEKAKSLDPQYEEAFFSSAETLVKLKRYQDAVADYRKAVELRPAYFDAWFGLAETYFELKNYPEAVNAYKSAIKLKNDNWEGYAGLAESYRFTNAFSDAAANYNLAAFFLEKVKDHTPAAMADLHSKAGFVLGQKCDAEQARNLACRWDGAIKSLQTAAELSQNPIDYVNLGWAYFRAAHPDAEAKNMAAAMPNLQAAKAALEKALTGPPAVAEYAMQNLAAVQIDMGDQKGAMETLAKLLEKRPEENSLRYQLGVAYFKSNDFANAEKYFRAALDKDPNYVFALTGLGETMIGRKNGKELKKVIERLRPLDAGAASRLELKAKAARLG